MKAMATADIGWTPTKLKTVVNAIDAMLALVPKDNMLTTDAEKAIVTTWRWSKRDELKATQRWSKDVHVLLNQSDGSFRATDVPKFPLTSEQLLKLQDSIEHLALTRAAVTIENAEGTSEHVQHSFRHLTISAYLLGIMLFASAILTSLVILHQLVPGDWLKWFSTLIQSLPGALTPVLRIVAITIPWIAFVFWVIELTRLYRHQHELRQSGHPVPPLHWLEQFLSRAPLPFERSTTSKKSERPAIIG